MRLKYPNIESPGCAIVIFCLSIVIVHIVNNIAIFKHIHNIIGTVSDISYLNSIYLIVSFITIISKNIQVNIKNKILYFNYDSYIF